MGSIKYECPILGVDCKLHRVTPPELDNVEPLFYIVWCEESDKPIRKKYTSLKQAKHVVDNMRVKEPHMTFHIMAKVEE